MPLKIACVGGGPGGLLFATLIKRADPSIEVTVFERNQADDAFGFGVVFSDSTLRTIHQADDALDTGLAGHGRRWDSIEVWAKGDKRTFHGNGMSAIHRRTLLPLLHRSAGEAGVELRFGVNIAELSELSDYDVIVGADGANSRIRQSIDEDLGHTVERADAKFIWFGTDFMFDGLTFVHRRSEHGNFAAHAYPISESVSTFIVETDEETWRRAGLDGFDVTSPPGESDEKSRRYIEELFAEDINDGEIIVNNSRWGNFQTRRTQKWHSGNVVLLGDAVHTAHFSVGSGTKMAMEDAIVLARELTAGHSDLESAFQAYNNERGPSVNRIQDSARGGLSWWEHFGLYHDTMDPEQFAFHFFSRSIGIDRIEPRDPQLVGDRRAKWHEKHGANALESTFEIGGATLPSRILIDDGQRLVASPDNMQGVDVASSNADSTTSDGRAIRLIVPDGEQAESAEETASSIPDGLTTVISGGSPLNRVRVSEERRLRRGGSTVLVISEDDGLDPETLILSGRADAVAWGPEHE